MAQPWWRLNSMKYIPRLPRKNVNVTPTSPLRDLLTMLGGITLILVAVYIVLGLAVDFMVPRISPETEKMLGEYIHEKWSGTEEYPKQEKQLQAILNKIQEKCGELPYPLEIKVAESDMINALALPGGRILILTGLLEKVQSENELAFVLAHEMGHFANRDHLSEMGRGLVFIAMSAGVFGPNSFIGQQLGKLLQVSELGFSRKHESMADHYALGVQNCVYGHVAGAKDFFAHTARMEKESFTGHYLSSHPDAEDRIAALNNLAVKQGYVQYGGKIPFAMAFPKKKGKPRGD